MLATQWICMVSCIDERSDFVVFCTSAPSIQSSPVLLAFCSATHLQRRPSVFQHRPQARKLNPSSMPQQQHA